MDVQQIFESAGLELTNDPAGVESRSPIDGSLLATVSLTSDSEIEEALSASVRSFEQWRQVPAPRRGELVRLLGLSLRDNKELLGRLISLECGKVLSEGLGEVQEMIDVCDFAVGLSRQLYGLTIASERPGHSMRETWHPLGVCGIITAFNFPVAVWSWNAALALVCGDSVIWKPSEKAPLTALFVHGLMDAIAENFAEAPPGLSALVIGERPAGELLVKDKRVALVSATGSTQMGRSVGQVVASRFGRSLLELGGNNAMVVTKSADLDLAVRGIVFSSVGTAGQRCTSGRRLFAQTEIYAELLQRLKQAYESLTVGNPLEANNLVGPLIDSDSYVAMQATLRTAVAEGATVTGGARKSIEGFEEAFYVQPAIVESETQLPVACHETFAPILYAVSFNELSDAIAANNNVPQGLSSSIFTTDVREAELFISAVGSDCGIANVNVGPSGAEIGGAFGGEKETGGGRESGSDSWKAYMRRQTNTVNYSSDLPLAQGVTFEVQS